MKKLAVSLIVAATLALGLVAATPLPSVGSMAPNFTLPNNDGQRVSLSQYRGQWVVLYFYPADFTSGCTIEAHNFQRDLAQFKALHAVILGVSVQSVDSHKKFCTKEGLHFHLLADTQHQVTALYGSLHNYGKMGTLALRNTFLIDPSGKIVKVFTKVNPSIHSAQVQEALKAAQAQGD
ncbi:MAG TPA: peroxiredoxin [Terriglobales bacterium]|nr:peroxiredoxin [Terriglobales bacterium]